MIILIHLLEHLGVPSGVAIAVIIAAMRVLRGGGAKLTGRRDRGLGDYRDGGQGDYRDRGRGRGGRRDER